MKKTLQERANAQLPRGPLSADEILSAEDIGGGLLLRAVPVPTPEWKPGSTCYVAELSANERDALEEGWIAYKEALIDGESNVGFRAWAAAFCLCDEKRQRLFEGREQQAAQRIGDRNGKATSRLFNVISKINGLTKADVDELEKNSDATPPMNADGNGESPSA